jgi:hypothetical protein
MTHHDRSMGGDGVEGSSSFREIAASAHEGGRDRAQARYAETHASLIGQLQEAGHSIVFSTRSSRGEAGTTTRVTMWCNNCWKQYRGVMHRWWGLSKDRPCR